MQLALEVPQRVSPSHQILARNATVEPEGMRPRRCWPLSSTALQSVASFSTAITLSFAAFSNLAPEVFRKPGCLGHWPGMTAMYTLAFAELP